MKRRRPARIIIRSMDRRQIQTIHNQIPHKMRGMSRRHEVQHRRRQQETLLHLPRAIRFAHPQSESDPPIHVQAFHEIVDGLLVVLVIVEKARDLRFEACAVS